MGLPVRAACECHPANSQCSADLSVLDLILMVLSCPEAAFTMEILSF